MASPNGKTYEFGHFRLVPDEGLLLRDGEPVQLSLKAFATLVILVERHGHLVQRSELIESVWQDTFVEEANISKCVWSIRNALGEDPKESKFVQTIPRRGYRFVAPVTTVNNSSGAFRRPLLPEDYVYTREPVNGITIDGRPAAEIARSNGETSEGRVVSNFVPARIVPVRFRHLLSGRRWAILAVAAAALFGSAGFYVAFSGRDLSGRVRGNRIAILPLKPLDIGSRDPSYDLGIAEALILKLSPHKVLTVRPLSAVRNFTDVNTDAPSAGKELKADYVLSSNYQIAGGRIKVTAQFLEVATGNVIDTIQVEHPLGTSFIAQDAVANEIGNRLLARFGSDAGDFRTRRGTDNQDAYRYYLMAMNITEERGVQNVHKALEFFEKAVELDPKFARAWAGIAHTRRDLVGHRDPDAKGNYEKSMDAINKALAIDPNLSDAYSSLCQNKLRYEYDPVGAEKECKRALELDPNSPLAHKIYANFLYSQGRFDESIASIKTAMDLQPVSYRNQQIYGLALFYARRFPDAEAQFKHLLDLNPNHTFIHQQLVTILLLQKKEAEAFGHLINGLMITNANDPMIERYKAAYAIAGWRGVTLEQIKTEDKARTFEFACLYARIGDKDKAFEYLGKAYDERSHLIAVLKVAPQLDPLRDDPRYAALVRRIDGK
ncbi:MAG: winged helix-turn-helix domain-containing protein [Acidobacteria bacterium]|nr:winged helix-turn-helix domain-containing protein [Acidobacteriota bacterium]